VTMHILQYELATEQNLQQSCMNHSVHCIYIYIYILLLYVMQI
jgi:hypothetical protein